MVEMYRDYFRNIKVRISVIGALRKVGVGSLEIDIADDCPRLNIHGGVIGDDVKHGFGEMNDGEFLSMATVSASATFKHTKDLPVPGSPMRPNDLVLGIPPNNVPDNWAFNK
jgi:hypothetical protein